MRLRAGVALLVLSVASPLYAAEPEGAEAASTEAAAPGQKLDSVVRGLYIETRVGGGIGLMSQEVPSNDPAVKATEELGAGSFIGFALGYDLTDNLAFQLLGGAALVSGNNLERVRDLGMFYGGAGLRLAVDLSERLDVVVSGGGAMARTDNGVEAAKTGPAVLATAGFEYYVHVRHFSVGLEVTALVPLSPMRAFVGLGPQIKYTF